MDMKERFKQNSRAMKCKCGNNWLTELVVAKYNGDQFVAMGQPLQPVSDKFIIYNCPMCGEFLLPKVHLTTQDSVRRDYDDMYDSLIEPPKETKTKEQEPDKTVEVAEPDAAKSEKKGKAEKGDKKEE